MRTRKVGRFAISRKGTQNQAASEARTSLVNRDTMGTQNAKMNTSAAALIFGIALTEAIQAGRPFQPEPLPPCPAQVARILEALPQGGTRVGGSVVSTPSALGAADQEFVKAALAIVTAEARIGKLVAELGATEELRALGNELFVNQTRNAAALREAARAKNFEAETRLSAEQEALVDSFRLKALETLGPAFQECVNNDRSGAISVFAQGARGAKDPNLRRLAEQVVGELRTERPEAAAAIAAAAAKHRAIAEVPKSPEMGNPTAANRAKAGSPVKASRANSKAATASRRSKVPVQTSVPSSSVEEVSPAPTPTTVGGVMPATPTAPRPFRTERNPNGRIKMSPMISADVAEKSALPSREVFRREVFRSSEEETGR
jgi:hypothetical protein